MTTIQARTGTFGVKKYSLYVCSALIVSAMLMCGGELYFGSLDGDLTRLGTLSEKDFGWNQTQPLVETKYLHSYPIDKADVLIVGDSFSATLVWQSKLVRGRLKPATLHWDDVKLCTNDFAQVIRQAGFTGRYVVIEAVERTLQDRMHSVCNKGSKIAKKTEFNRPSPPTNLPRFSPTEPRLGAKWVIEATLNKFRYRYLPSDHMQFGSTQMFALENGCKRFTNRLCSYGLFFADEFSKTTFNSVDTVLAINQNLMGAGLQTLWLVVPDKSTVYLGNGKFNSNPYVNPWKSFQVKDALGIPDLDQRFIQESYRLKDFYAPNNTHLSTAGYLLLGDLMLDLLHKLERPADSSHYTSSSPQDVRKKIPST